MISDFVCQIISNILIGWFAFYDRLDYHDKSFSFYFLPPMITFVI